MIRRSPLPPVDLDLDLDAATNGLVGTAADTSIDPPVSVNGWRNVWSKSVPASSHAGYHTFASKLEAPYLGDMAWPQGSNHGSLTIDAKTGNVTVAGRVADDLSTTPLSSTGPLGPNGEVQLFHTRYPSSSGSLRALLRVAPGNHVISGSADWAKASQDLSHRAYTSGYAEFPQKVVGGLFEKVIKPGLPLGLVSESDSATLSFSFGGIGDTLVNPSQLFTVTSPATPRVLPNQTSTTLAISSSSGRFNGAFLVQPRSRSATFAGILVRDEDGVQRGYGFFLLPLANIPNGFTASNTPVLSGRVLLSK